ncbi:MAG: NfeD family protein [Pseudomonadota bacterium]|nr:NfeD family protein [Pseudomonadota bacterium]
MIDWLAAPAYWNWWILGAVLLVIEALAPGTFFLWLGIAAFLLGLLLVVVDLSWQAQWLVFALLSVVSIVVSRIWFRRHPGGSADPLLNRRGRQYVGRVLTLDAPIVDGQGRCRVGDSVWKVTGPDCPAGTRVRVVGVEGVALRVEVV